MHHTNHPDHIDDTDDTSTPGTDTDAGTAAAGRAITRRGAIGGAIGAGLIATGLIQIARAQTDGSATPEAGTDATPASETSDDEDDATEEATRRDAAIERAMQAIAWAESDRDAVASQIDATVIDELLSQATDLLDRAGEAEETAEALRLARAAAATAEVAQHLVVAELAYAELPSQEARASRVLARAHETIEAVATELGASSDTDTDFFLTTAQSLYETAYDEFAAGSWERAALRANAAGRLAHISLFLTAETGGAGRDRDGRDGGVRGGSDGPGMREEGGPSFDSDADEPVTVPAPDFDS